MSRRRYRYVQNSEGKWVSELVAVDRNPVELHYVIQDTIDPTMCHADGNVYESRAEMNRAIKASGAEPLSESDKRRMADRIANGEARKPRGSMESRQRLREVVEEVYYKRRDGMIPNADQNLPTMGEVVRRLTGKE